MTKILALTIASALAGFSLSVPTAINTDASAPAVGVAVPAGEALAVPADVVAATAEASKAPTVDLFVYHEDGVRDPFVPLILPTPVPALDLVGGASDGSLYNEILAEGMGPDGALPEDSQVAIEAAPTPAPEPELPENVQLECILWSENQQVAVVDGEFLVPGDELDGILVKSIAEKSVAVEYEGKNFELRIPTAMEQLEQERLDKVRANPRSSALRSNSPRSRSSR